MMVLLTSVAGTAAGDGHSGIVHPRTGPAMSDIALFVFAAIAVWLVRRAMRARFARRDDARADRLED